MTQPQPPKNGLAIAALVMGVVAVIGSFFLFVNVGAIVVGLTAAILGLIAVLTHKSKVLSISGLVLGLVAILISVLILAMFAKSVRESLALSDITYTATVSEGTATAAWGTEGRSSSQDFTGTWTQDSTGSHADIVATLTVRGSADQELTCEITIDGKVMDSESGTSFVTCTVSLAGT